MATMPAGIGNDSTREHFGDAVGSTLAISLFARAKADERFDVPEWRDDQAKQVWDKLEAEAAERGERLEDLTMPGIMTMVGTVRRSQAIDDRVREFASAHPGGRVVSLGIGLCNRAARLADLDVEWVGLDRADVVALRRRLVPEDPTRLVVGSVTDPDWLEQVDPQTPTLYVAEGLLMYLTEGLVAQLLVRIGDHSQGPTQLVADAHMRSAAKSNTEVTKKTGAQFHFGVRSGEGFAAMAPGWRLVSQVDTMAPIARIPAFFSGGYRRLTGKLIYGVYTLERA